MNDHLALSGCIMTIGQVVKKAIQDAGMINSKYNRSYIHDANRFLFSGKFLERFFNKYHILEHINCEFVRNQARDVIAGNIDINDVELKESEIE